MFHRVKSEQQSGGGSVQDTSMNDVNRAASVASEPAESQESKQAFEYTPVREQEAPAEKFYAVKKENNAEERSASFSASAPSYKSQSYLQVSNPEKEEKEEKTMADQDTTKASSPARPAEATAPASIYQRAGTAPAAMGSYTPSYSPYSSSASSSPAAEARGAGGDSKLTIGRGITMSGEIESCDHLQVEGTVEAALKGARLLDIAETGVFYGTVEIDEANISGRFEGELVVRGRLTVESTGVITGTISYGEIQLEAGAVIDGRLTPVGAMQPKSASSAPKSPAMPMPPRKAAPPAGAGLFKEERESMSAE